MEAHIKALRMLVTRYGVVYRFGLAFAFLKIFAIPQIARVLADSGKLVDSPRERFNETAKILMQLVLQGTDGQDELFERMRRAHDDPRITADALEYVLCLIVTEPLEWIGASDPAAVCHDMRTAHWELWRNVAEKMNLPRVPSSYEACLDSGRAYENLFQAHDACAEPLVGQFLGNVLLPMAARMGYINAGGHVFLREACSTNLSHALCLEPKAHDRALEPSSGAPVALITGCSTGFGYLTAVTLARRGFRVFASMRDIAGRNRPSAEALAREQCHTVEIDVRNDHSVTAAVDVVMARAGRLDVVINNAGVFALGLDEAFTDDQVQSLFDTNVFGVQRVIRASLPAMRSQGSGLFITISSVSAQLTFPFMGLYAASKKAVDGLAESYRYQLAPLGIDSIIVEPGTFATSLLDNALLPADEARAASCGDLFQLTKGMVGRITKAMRRNSHSGPQVVADVIAQLIAMPFGQRPLRTCIDAEFGDIIERVHVVSTQAQAAVAAAVGYRPRCPRGQERT